MLLPEAGLGVMKRGLLATLTSTTSPETLSSSSSLENSPDAAYAAELSSEGELERRDSSEVSELEARLVLTFFPLDLEPLIESDGELERKERDAGASVIVVVVLSVDSVVSV